MTIHPKFRVAKKTNALSRFAGGGSAAVKDPWAEFNPVDANPNLPDAPWKDLPDAPWAKSKPGPNHDPWAEFSPKPPPFDPSKPFDVQNGPDDWVPAAGKDDWVPAAPASPTSTAKDVAKSGASGLAEGLINLAAAGPLAVNALSNKVVDAANWIAPGSDVAKWLKEGQSQAEQNRETIRRLTGPKFYEHEPTTAAGRYTKAAAEFVPAAVTANPEAALVPMVTKTLPKMAVLPGMASEAAGELTQGTPFEEPARIAAAALASRGAARAGAPGAPKPPKVPTVEELHEAAENNFNNVRGYGVELHPQSTARLADDIRSDLESSGFRDYNMPKTFRAIDELKQPAGRNATIDDIWNVRKALGNSGWEERAASSTARGAIDDYLARLAPQDAAVNGQFVTRLRPELREGLQNYAAAKRAEELSEIRQRGEDSARGTNDAILSQYRRILGNPRLRRGYSDDEINQMRRAVQGTVVGNVAHTLGYLAPSHPLTGLAPAAGAFFAGAGPAAFAGPAIGQAAKTIGNFSTGRNIDKLERMVRMRSPLAQGRQAEFQDALSKTRPPGSPRGVFEWQPESRAVLAADAHRNDENIPTRLDAPESWGAIPFTGSR